MNLKVGIILKNAREELNLSQIDVMKATGINNKTLSGYENGVSDPDIDTLVLLFRFYGLSADEVFKLCKPQTYMCTNQSERTMLRFFREMSADQQLAFVSAAKAVAGYNKQQATE